MNTYIQTFIRVIFLLLVTPLLSLQAQVENDNYQKWQNKANDEYKNLKAFEEYEEKPLAMYGIIVEEDSLLSPKVHNELESALNGTTIASLNLTNSPPSFACLKRCFKKVTLRLVFENVTVDNGVGYDYRFAGYSQNWTANFECIIKAGTTNIGTPVIRQFAISRNVPQQVLEIDITQYAISCENQSSVYDQTINIVKNLYQVSNGATDVYNKIRMQAYIVREIMVEDQSVNQYKLVHSPLLQTNQSSDNNPLNFGWLLQIDNGGSTPCDSKFAFPNYQFQILKLLNTGSGSYLYNENILSGDIDWSKALTIETYSSLPKVTLTMGEGRGFYVWRVRGIGNKEKDGIVHPDNWGEWSDFSIPDLAKIKLSRVISGQSVDTSANTFGAVDIDELIIGSSSVGQNDRPKYKVGVFFYRGIENERNWIYSRSFTEGTNQQGPQIGESMVFANGLLQVQQKQAKMASKDSLIISATVYDFTGRPAVSSLPAPLNKKGFGFDANALVGSSGQFNAFDFDTDANLKILIPTTVTTGTIGSYYSGNHPVQTIPSASGYPYSRTLFEANPLGRVVKQGGVGNENISGTKTVRVEYLPTSEQELVSVFGDEAPKAENVSKIKTTDQNGVVTISYQLAEGKTIATCFLVNQGSSEFLSLTSTGNDGEKLNNITVVDTARGILEQGPGRYISSTRFSISAPQACTLNYSITRKKLESECPNFCKFCDYNIGLKVLKVNENGELVSSGINDWVLDKRYDTLCSASPNQSISNSVHFLQPGTYEIQRVIILDNAVDVQKPGQPTVKRKSIDAHIDEETEKFSKHFYSPATDPAPYTPSFLARYFGPRIDEYMNNSVPNAQRNLLFEDLLSFYTTKYNQSTINEKNSTPLALGDFSCYTTNLPEPNCKLECIKAVDDLDFAGYLADKIVEMNSSTSIPSILKPVSFLNSFQFPNIQINAQGLPEAFSQNGSYYSSIYSPLSEGDAKIEFNDLIKKMINEGGYDCKDLWRCWRSIVDAYPYTYLQSRVYTKEQQEKEQTGHDIFIKTNNLNLLEKFLDCVGRKLCSPASTRQDYYRNAYQKVYRINTTFYNICRTELFGNIPPQLTCSGNSVVDKVVKENNEKLHLYILSKAQGYVNLLAYGDNDPYLLSIYEKTYDSETQCCNKLSPSYNPGCCSTAMEKKMKKDVTTNCNSECDKLVAKAMSELVKDDYLQGAKYPPGSENIIKDSTSLPENLRSKYVSTAQYGCWEEMVKQYCYSFCDYTHPDVKERMKKVMTYGLHLKKPTKQPNNEYTCEVGYELLNNAQKTMGIVLQIMNKRLKEFRAKMTNNGPDDFVINSMLDEVLTNYPTLQLYCKTGPYNLDIPNSVKVYKNDLSEFFIYKDPVDNTVCRIGYRTITDDKYISDEELRVTFGYLNCDRTVNNRYPTERWAKSQFVTWLNWETSFMMMPLHHQYGISLYSYANKSDAWVWEFLGDIPKANDSCTSLYPLYGSQQHMSYLKWNPPIHMTEAYRDSMYQYPPSAHLDYLTEGTIPCINGTNYGIFRPYEIMFRPNYTIHGAFVRPYAPTPGDDTRNFVIYGRLLYQIRNPIAPFQIDSIEFWLEPQTCSGGVMSNNLTINIRINTNDLRTYSIPYTSEAASHLLLGCDQQGFPSQSTNFFKYFGYFDINDQGYLIFNDAQGGNDNGSVPDYVFQHIRFNCFNPNCQLDTIPLFCMPCSGASNCPVPLCATWTEPKTYDPTYFPRPIGCEQLEVERLINHFRYTYQQQHKKAMDTLRARYTRICANPKNVGDVFTVKYSEGYMHYTLYYYDRGGRLVKTIPPKGVIPQPAPPYTRTAMSHNFITNYYYNSIGQLVEQSTPDGGITKFVYDDKGRVRFSQNAKQKNASSERYSYKKYDAKDRLIEIGEFTGTLPTVSSANNADYPSNSYSSATYAIKTIYGDFTPLPYTSLPAPYNISSVKQRNVLNRISYTIAKQPDLVTSAVTEVKTYYSYDPHGNVEWIIHDIPTFGSSKIDYEYDLISGKVTEVKYRDGYPDCFYQRYAYDADNRLVSVSTSRDGKIWDRDARYTYYAHGPLRRAVIGEDAVQGMDYTYTIEGWPKAINHPLLPSASGNPGAFYDPGKDGQSTSVNTNTARDAFGAVLTYNNSDFIRTNSVFNQTSARPTLSMQLYNGDVTGWLTSYRGLNINGSSASDITAGIYKNDYLGRIRENQTRIYPAAGGSWTQSNKWINTYDYDPNGNIMRLERYNGADPPIRFDSLTYKYSTGTNKLRYVHDAEGDVVGYDIDGQGTDNYKYDEIGSLLTDDQEGIQQTNPIIWTPASKVYKITKQIPNGNIVITFLYNGAGHRVAKRVSKTENSIITNNWTWYVHDGTGNTIASYTREGDNVGDIIFEAAPIYGLNRLGMYKPKINRNGIFGGNGTNSIFSRSLAIKQYELKDHQGNVRVVINDKKLSTTGEMPFNANVINYTNYYPFGMQYNDNATVSTEDYRYGYQGQEKIDEIYGNGNYIDFTYRGYNPRLGRFFALDPLASKYPYNSPYAFAENQVITFIELEGLEKATPEEVKEAQDKIDKFAKDKTTKTVWKGVSKEEFVNSLKDAINGEGKEFVQGQTSLCGVAAACKVGAELNPSKFVDMAISLYEKGTYSIQGGTLNANSKLTNDPNPENAGLSPMGFVVFTSIRHSLNLILSYKPELDSEGSPTNHEQLSGMTFPTEFHDMMVDAMGTESTGLQRGLAFSNSPKYMKNALNSGDLLIAAVDGGSFDTDDKWSSPVPTHYIQITGVKENPNGTLTVDWWSWGNTHTTTKPKSWFDVTIHSVFSYR